MFCWLIYCASARTLYRSESFFNSLVLEGSVKRFRVIDCIFQGCSSLEIGGAISSSSEDSDLYIRSCLFVDCNTKVHGGGVYTQNTNFTILTSCFYLCKCGYVSAGYGTAFFSGKFSSVNLTSAAFCPGDVVVDNGVMCIHYSSVMIGTNVSYSKTSFNSGPLVLQYHSSLKVGSISYSGTYHNSNGAMIGFQVPDYEYTLSFYNFVNHSGHLGVIFCWGENKVICRESHFVDIDGQLAFGLDSKSILKLESCYFDNNYPMTSGLVDVVISEIHYKFNLTPRPISCVLTHACVGNVAVLETFTRSFTLFDIPYDFNLRIFILGPFHFLCPAELSM